MCSQCSGYAKFMFAFDSKLKLEQSIRYKPWHGSVFSQKLQTTSAYPNSQHLSDLGNAFELSIQKPFLIIKLLNDCPVFIFSLIHSLLFFLWVNLRPKSNNFSRYFHGLFCTLIILALHDQRTPNIATSQLCAIKVMLEAEQHSLYRCSFGTSLYNRKYTWTKLNWITSLQ